MISLITSYTARPDKNFMNTTKSMDLCILYKTDLPLS